MFHRLRGSNVKLAQQTQISDPSNRVSFDDDFFYWDACIDEYGKRQFYLVVGCHLCCGQYPGGLGEVEGKNNR
jgi:hypothetical protein